MVMPLTSESAALIFTAATVLIGIEIMLLSQTWRIIQKALAGLTPQQRRLAFKERNFEDTRYRRKAWLLNLLFDGCGSLTVSILFNLVAIIGISSTMLELHWGVYQADKFSWGVYSLQAGVATFAIGISFIGLALVREGIGFRLGRPSSLFIKNTVGSECEQSVVQEDENLS